MPMEAQRGSLVDENRTIDRFPVGMRVLAVDDDPICLKVLDNLLRKCQYQVTTTNQAIKALQMLRENRNKFDLVISDVNMPDMDGFKLLEQVGLEMDLPVIMLSAHSDTNLVMKGVTHGACDYLLKPVRIEELKNIWQHVIRRKKFDSREQNKASSQDKAQCATGDGARGITIANNADQNGKSCKKRKDQNEDDDEDPEENATENDDPSTQKKPRVVWSVELHRKFVAAVKQLGLEKAVPKKILDLMKVEGLTRENVASHLQKYRLYLKRIHTEETQQAHMIAALGGKDYMRMASLDGFGDFRSLSGSGRLPSTFSSYTSGGLFGRLNSPAALSLHGIATSGLIQSGQSQSLSSSMNTLGKNQPAVLPPNQSSNLFQGIPTSLELNQLQQSNCTSSISQFTPVNDSNGLTVPAHFPDSGVSGGCSSNSLPIVSSSGLMFQGNPQQGSAPYGNADISGSSSLLDYKRCNESWQSAAQPSKFSSNSLPSNEPFNGDPLALNGLNIPSSSPHIGKSPIDFSSTNAASIPLEDSHGGVQCQEAFIDNVMQSASCMPKPRWEDNNKPDYQTFSLPFNTMNSLVSSACVTMSAMEQDLQQNNAFCTKRIDDSLFSQLNGAAASIQISDLAKFSMGSIAKHNELNIVEQMKSHAVQNNFGSLDDIMSAMVKREQGRTLMNGDLGLDAYPVGSCI